MADLPEIEEKSMEGLEEIIDISRILKRLPEELQETAILYFFQERKQKEIAKIAGISLSLVKYRIRRVRELLAKELKMVDFTGGDSYGALVVPCIYRERRICKKRNGNGGLSFRSVDYAGALEKSQHRSNGN